MRDKTMKILGQMEEMAHNVEFCAKEMYTLHDNAQYEFERLGVEDDFLTGDDDDAEFLADDMTDAVEVMDEYTKDFHAELAEFDAELMKLIQLRGQLAEQLDIPIGGAKWVRYETYTM
jgi:hypothetical protein